MLFKWFAAWLVFLPSFILSLETSSNVIYSLDKNAHVFGVESQVVQKIQENDILVTPRVYFNDKKELDVTLGIGFRHYVNDQTFGINSSWDISDIQGPILNQFGIGVEYFFGSWCLRSNHYFPVTRPFITGKCRYNPIYWMDNSAQKKFKYFSTSIGSVYDFNDKKLDIKGSLFIPYKGVVFGIHGNYPVSGNASTHFSLSFGYSVSKKQSEPVLPIVRNSKVRYSINRVEKEIEKKDEPVQEALEEVLEVLEGEIEEALEQEIEDELPAVGWLDWFKSFFTYDSSNDPYRPINYDEYLGRSWDFYPDRSDTYYAEPLTPSVDIASSPSFPSISSIGSLSPIDSPSGSGTSPSYDDGNMSNSGSSSDGSFDFASPTVDPQIDITGLDLTFPSASPESSDNSVDSSFSWDGTPIDAPDFSGAAANHYGPGDFYDPSAVQPSPVSDNGWTPISK